MRNKYPEFTDLLTSVLCSLLAEPHLKSAVHRAYWYGPERPYRHRIGQKRVENKSGAGDASPNGTFQSTDASFYFPQNSQRDFLKV